MSPLMVTKKIVPKLLLQVSAQKQYNIILIPPEEGGPEEARYPDKTFIISDSTLHNILTPQLRKMTSRYRSLCGCEFCISEKSTHSSLLSRCVFFNLKSNI